MRASRLLAAAAFVCLVPACIGVAYAGYRYELYPYPALPAVFGGLFVAGIAGLFFALPRLRERAR